MKKLAKGSKFPSTASTVFTGYGELLGEIKTRIRAAQIRAVSASNAEMLQLYWEVGGLLIQKQKQAGWGMRVLCQLAQDFHNDLPDVKGFSERNLRLMTQFFREYADFSIIWQQAVAQLESASYLGQSVVALLPWAHNILLIQKVKKRSVRLWYAEQALQSNKSKSCSGSTMYEKN